MRLVLKLGLLFILCCSSILAILYIKYARYHRYSFPLHHLSNSVSYNSNLQSLIGKNDLSKTEFLIIGSSMSLNNISAKMIQDTFNQRTYNISSWGFKPEKVIEFLKKVEIPSCKKVLVAFNNVDFSAQPDAKYDFSGSNRFIYGNIFTRVFIFLRTFTFSQFDEDSGIRERDTKIYNDYGSLAFDSNGSVLFDRRGFNINGLRYAKYDDTSGFDIFCKNMTKLKFMLMERRINLTFAYLPYRQDLLNADRAKQNDAVAEKLEADFPGGFIDLHKLNIDSSLYCDASHLFKAGAEILTKTIIDSLKR